MDVTVYHFALFLLPILTCVLILLIGILVINRLRYDLLKPKLEATKNEIDNFLTNLIFLPFDETYYKAEIEQFKKIIPFEKKWCKKLILNEIIFLKSNLKGDVTKTFQFIYVQFGLFDYTKTLLKSRRFYLKCLGMYQLQALEYKKGKKYIMPLLDSKNRNIHSSAFLTLISIDPNELKTLINYKNPVRIAGEINFMDVLHQKKTKMPPNLSQWIYSDNLSVVKIGIKLMIFYNFTKENEKIIKLLKHKDRTVRFEAISAVNFLFIHEAETALIEQFENEDTQNKLEIFTTLSHIGTTESEIFITDLLEKKTNENIKLDAVYCLFKINPTYFDSHFVDNEDVQKMVKHVKTPNL